MKQMKIILPLFVLTLSFFCCTQTSNADKKNLDSSSDSNNNKNTQRGDTSSLTVFKTYYVLSLPGKKRKIKTQEELSEILTKDYNQQDSLYIFIDEASGNKIENAMESIRNSQIEKYRVIGD